MGGTHAGVKRQRLLMLPLLVASLGIALAAGWLLLGLVDVPAWTHQFSKGTETVPVADVYGANEVGQSFHARWDGLSRVDFLLETTDRPHRGIYRLRALPDDVDVFVGEFSCPTAERWCSLTFPPVRDSNGRAFAILLESPSVEASAAVIVSAWTENVHPSGNLLLNGENIPLDLVFRPYYRLHSWSDRIQWLGSRWQELIRVLDGPVTSPGIGRRSLRKLSLVALNMALFSLFGAIVITSASQPRVALARWLGLAVLVGELLVFALGVLGVCAERWIPPYTPREVLYPGKAGSEMIVNDLLLDLTTGDVTYETDPNLVGVRWFDTGGCRQPVLWAHAFSCLHSTVRVPVKGVLKFGVALSPETWDKEGDGVEFVITVSTAETMEQVYWRAVDPAHNPEDRRWFEEQVDLSHYAGQEVLLTLNTYPRSNNSWDWAGWGHPIITGLP